MSYAPIPAEDDQPSQAQGTRHLERGSFLTVAPDGTYSYAYGPRGLTGLINNKYALGCALLCSLGGLTFGYDQGVIANILVMQDFKRRFPITPFEQGLLTALLELGALCGALASGVYANHMSRRASISWSCAVFCIGSAVQCASNSVGTLSAGRAIGGVGIGALSTLCPLYMAEISPPEIRGSLLSIEQFSIVSGVVIGFWLGFCTRNIPGELSWRIPLGAQLIPGVLLACGFLFLPPSPRLLVSGGRHEDALKALSRLRMRPNGEVDDLVQIELLEMRVEAELVSAGKPKITDTHTMGSELASWIVLFEKQYRAQTWIGISVMFFQQWSGINSLLYYSPLMMHSMGLEGATVELISSGFVSIVQLLAVIPAILYIDRLGRKPLLMGGSIVMAASHACIAVLVWYGQDDWKSHQQAAWSAVAFIYLFTAAYGVSFGPVAWVLPNEIFPLTVRGKGVALSTASVWWNNFLIGLVTPPLLAYSPGGTYVLFSVACLAAYFWSKICVPETRGRSLEEMDALFNTDVGTEAAQRKRDIEEALGLPRRVQACLEGGY